MERDSHNHMYDKRYTKYDIDFYHARLDHAIKLRSEGLSFTKIGKRLGLSTGRAQYIIWSFMRSQLPRYLWWKK